MAHRVKVLRTDKDFGDVPSELKLFRDLKAWLLKSRPRLAGAGEHDLAIYDGGDTKPAPADYDALTVEGRELDADTAIAAHVADRTKVYFLVVGESCPFAAPRLLEPLRPFPRLADDSCTHFLASPSLAPCRRRAYCGGRSL